MEESFKARLGKLQAELKAPKNMYNSFGKYSYRNAEGIMEAVKPLLVKYGMILNVSDGVELIGERYYIRAIATVTDTDTLDSISSTAYARESLDKKGMDDSQITGTASSYARKYALNGLFLLDDTKDADTDEYHNQTNKPKNDEKDEKQFNEQAKKDLANKASQAQKNTIMNMCNAHKISTNALLQKNNLTLETLTAGQATQLIVSLKNKFGDE